MLVGADSNENPAGFGPLTVEVAAFPKLKGDGAVGLTDTSLVDDVGVVDEPNEKSDGAGVVALGC